MSEHRMQTLEGLGVSDGIAIGRAVCLDTRIGDVYRFPLDADRVEPEVERFELAVAETLEALNRLRSGVGEDFGDELAAIFDAHILFLKDPAYLNLVVRRIRDERVNAEWAVYRAAQELDERFARIRDPYLRERNQDLEDVSHQLLRALQGIGHHELSEIETEVVIVANDLTPSEAVRLGRQRVVAFAIEGGGRTSHTTIVARSLSLPAVTGLAGITELLTDQDPVIVDGEQGRVILHPTREVLEEYRRRQRTLRREARALLANRELAATTRDGVEIALMANVDLPEEADEVEPHGAQGIGLYRSEFLYIEKSPRLPTEEEHYDLYRRLAEAAAPHPAVIRTYDLGGRKLARELLDCREENPVLGLRGIRLTLARPEVFQTQLRAIFRAALCGNLWLMVPLVSTVEEVRRFRAFAERVRDDLVREGIPCARQVKTGIMIEVPSAAAIADLLAREVDFFSIGTNDLIQYALAVDRNNEQVADLYQPLHPGILRMLRFVVASGREAGIEVSVCGEMAADLRLVPLLIGLGVRRLSVSPRRVPAVKNCVRELCAAELEELAVRAMALATARDVEGLLDAQVAPPVSEAEQASA